LVAALGGGIVVVADAAADCPANLCDCLDDAGRFTVLGDQVQVKSGRISVSGYGYAFPSVIEGSVCGATGRIGGKADGETDVSANLLFTAGPGVVAAKFKGFKYYGYAYPGAYVGGDVATGGGSLAGTGFVDVSGVIDTSGTYAGLSSCSGALVDAAEASAFLATLPATQPLTSVLVTNGDTFTITGTSGVNVVNVDSINLKPARDYYGPIGSVLEISLPGPGDVMIVNVATSLQVGLNSAIFVVDGGPENVIINVHGGAASKVKIGGFEATVDPSILAPGAKVLAKGDSYLSNMIGGAKTKIQGPEIGDTLLCP
jgi:choice-of-anchor A domain-containing protein